MSKEILNRTESEWKLLIAKYEERSVSCAYFCELHQVRKGRFINGGNIFHLKKN